ncbi:MAG: hypothetical protein ABIF77_09230, partial [bacterium]
MVGSRFRRGCGRIPLAATAGWFLLGLVSCPPGGPGAARGATIAVPDDVATIGAALARARSGDIVLVSCGTYREHDLVVPSGVTMWSGTLRPECVVIDAGGRGRVLVCNDADSTTAVVGFTLTGGIAGGTGDAGRGGAVFCRDAAVKLARCVLR